MTAATELKLIRSSQGRVPGGTPVRLGAPRHAPRHPETRAAMGVVIGEARPSPPAEPLSPPTSRRPGGASHTAPPSPRELALRAQLLRLAEHYATDVARLQRALRASRADATRAWDRVSEIHAQAVRAEWRALAAEAKVRALEAQRQRLEGALLGQRQRADAYSRAHETPWWRPRVRRAYLREAQELPQR